jgi:hypothetical protein
MWYIKAVRPHLECDFTPDREREENTEKKNRKRLDNTFLPRLAALSI